jgi:sec-independent protein translocase protein TatA
MPGPPVPDLVLIQIGLGRWPLVLDREGRSVIVGALSPTHWLIIIGVVVVLFGAKRLPDAARSLGRSARIFKAEVHEMGSHEPSAESAAAAPSPQPDAIAPVRPPTTAAPAPATQPHPASGDGHAGDAPPMGSSVNSSCAAQSTGGDTPR